MVENVWNKVILILVAVVGALVLFSITGVRQGLDLSGGARLVYKLDIAKARATGQVGDTTTDKEVVEETITILTDRIDPTGALDVVLQKQGGDRILVEIPGEHQGEIEEVQQRIQQLGKLEWILVVDKTQEEFDLEAERNRLKKWLEKPANQAIVGRNPLDISVFNSLAPDEEGPLNRFLEWVPMHEKSDRHGDLEISVPIEWTDNKGELQKGWTNSQGKIQEGHIRFLPVNKMETETIMSFSGEDLAAGSIKQTQDQYGRPAVAFEIRPGRKADFARFTEAHVESPFAIILNEYCRSAPVIQDRLPGRGIITLGSNATGEEVAELIKVLRTGALKIKPELESESTLGPTIGQLAIRTGTLSMIIGGALVLAFMVLFYRLTGIIAVLSLVVNVVLILGVMASFRFTLTLPGLAGLVLTMGMAVDANILIFERIREELKKGKVLAQAVKNGFQMAFSTIIDANVTTLITGLILYQVGTGPIRGFAITICVGIVTSIFAALVVSRVLFHLLHQGGIMKQITMGQVFRDPNYPFLGIRLPFNLVSAILIVVSIGVFFSTPRDSKLGIDFTGGASMRVILSEPHQIGEVRERILARMPSAQITTLQGSTQLLGKTEATTEGRAFAVKFKTKSEEEKFTDFRVSYMVTAGSEEEQSVYERPIRQALQGMLATDPVSDLETVSSAGGKSTLVDLVVRLEKPMLVEQVRKALAGLQNLEVTPAKDLLAEYREEIRQALEGMLVSAPVSDFDKTLSAEETYAMVDFQLHTREPVAVAALQEALSGFPELTITPVKEEDKGKESMKDFRIFMHMDAGVRESDLRDRLRPRLAGVKDVENNPITLSNPFPEFQSIGARVVGDLQTKAVLAIILSLFAVVMYIRVRFHEYKYGIAAVVALVHDVIIALGAVTLCNALGLVDAEINLPMIAAFLTIIGYSLNDTIVVFDRIRENLPRLPGTYQEILNQSINQTLSRTVWTSATTFMVLAVIFLLNYGQRNVLEGFSFAMLVGVIVGTYSSIFVASPALLMLHSREEQQKAMVKKD